MDILGATLAVLWSPHQDVFHVETVNEMQDENMMIYLTSKKGDFIVMGFAEDRKDADRIIKMLRETKEKVAAKQT